MAEEIIIALDDMNILKFVAPICGRVYPTPVMDCCGATASGRSREARARQIARAGKLQDKTRARLKKRARIEKAIRR